MSAAGRFLEFVISDDSSDLQTTIRIKEIGDGTLQFDVFLGDGATVGDLRALFFDVSDPSILSSLSAGVGIGDVTDEEYDSEDVSNLGQGANINGDIVQELGEFDGGVEFGTAGISTDDIRSTSFVLSSTTTALTLDMFEGQDFGLRINSVGTEGGPRNGSLKLAGTAAIAPNDDDLRTAEEDDPTQFDGAKDDASDFNFNILLNDGGDSATAVQTVNGDATNVGAALLVTSAGGRVGQVTITALGVVTFDPLGNFDSLALNETDTLSLEYTVTQPDGSASASPVTVTITINGENDAPTVAAPIIASASEDDATFSLDLLAGASDVDLSDTLSVSGLTLVSGDASGVTVTLDSLIIDPDAYNGLSAGDSEVIVYSYNVIDENGGTVSQTATVTITGENDGPPLFTEGADTLSFSSVVAGTYLDGSQYASLGGNDFIFLPNNSAQAAAAGFVLGTTFDAGDGNDRIVGGFGVQNDIFGGAGNDNLSGGILSDTIAGGDGADLINGGAGDDFLDGGSGGDNRDRLAFFFAQETTGVVVDMVAGTSTGSAGNDTFVNFEQVAGSNFADIITGDSGDNFLFGLGGGDTLLGGEGNDGFEAGDGDDTVMGEAGNDFIDGGLGDDTLNGGAGVDTVSFSSPAGGVSVDLAAGTAIGGTGSDTLLGIENVNGTSFNDAIVGDGGANRLWGRRGDDEMTGGAGPDTFIFIAGEDVDTITDFEDGTDIIDLFGFPVNDVSQLAISQNGLNAEIDFGSGDRLILENFTAALLDNSDFDF